MKSYIFIDEGLFFGQHGQAETLKCLITEDTFRSEEKFQSAVVLPSFHNFVVASNTHKAVNIPNEERRFFMLNCTRINYSKQHWEKLWSLVTDQDVRELFYLHCINLDVNCIQRGQAPFTAFKQVLQSEQAPMAIKWLKHVVLSDIDALNWQVPSEIKKPADRQQIAADLDNGLFSLKSRPADSSVYGQWLGPDYEEKALAFDLSASSRYKTLVPTKHVSECILEFFRGQAYRSSNEDDLIGDLAKLGLPRGVVKRVPTTGTTRRCIAFPSIQGIKFLLRRKKWLTEADESGVTEDE